MTAMPENCIVASTEPGSERQKIGGSDVSAAGVTAHGQAGTHRLEEVH